jgi:hypothetical protein
MKKRTYIVFSAVALIAGGIFLIRFWNNSADVIQKKPKITTSVEKQQVSPRYVKQIHRIADPGLHWEERILAVRDLPYRLGDESVDRLFAFLGERPAQGEEDWYLVCNEILEILRKRNLSSEIYSERLVSLIESSEADPMIRDYAAQHLAQWLSGIDPAAMEVDRNRAKKTFERLVAEIIRPENSKLTVAGTGLSALTDAVLNGDSIIQAEKTNVSEVALEMFANESASTANRTSALQSAARLDVESLAEVCRQTAVNKSASPDLRLSSIAALGQVGSVEDIPFIQGFAQEETFKFAAAGAVKRLKKISQ